jgi:hypothetical protein
MMRVLCCIVAVAVFASTALAGTTTAPAPDDHYIAAFNQHFHQRSAPVALGNLVSVQRYDELFMGHKLDEALAGDLGKLGGDIAWGLAYRMISLNDMFRLTHDPKYLQANLRCINAVMAVRDDRTGTKNFRGQIVPAWTSGHYTSHGRTVFLVHTGMIVYPMLDAIHLAATSPEVPADTKAELAKLLPSVLESLHYHDRQWHDGPGSDEGYYVGLDEEPAIEAKPQPANRLSAMGRCLWTAWLITNEPQYRTKARALGWYIKRRLTIGEDGAYYWAYSLPEAPVTKPVPINHAAFPGEDTSHATLTVSFPMMLAENHEVFTDDDMRRFAKTVTNGWGRLGKGVLFGNISGSPKSRPDLVIHPACWLPLAAYDPDVKNRIVPFYLNYEHPLRPEEVAPLLHSDAAQK